MRGRAATELKTLPETREVTFEDGARRPDALHETVGEGFCKTGVAEIEQPLEDSDHLKNIMVRSLGETLDCRVLHRTSVDCGHLIVPSLEARLCVERPK